MADLGGKTATETRGSYSLSAVMTSNQEPSVCLSLKVTILVSCEESGIVRSALKL